MSISLVAKCLDTAYEWNHSKHWIRGQLLSRAVTLVLVPGELAALISKVIKAIFLNCLGKIPIKIARTFSSNNKIKLWDNSLNLFQTIDKIGILAAGFFCTCFLSWSFPSLNSKVHLWLGLSHGMTYNIRSLNEEINQQQICGVPVTDIEKQAQVPTKIYFSKPLLGKTESLIDVLREDWKKVKKMGETHLQIAAKLRYALYISQLNIAENKGKLSESVVQYLKLSSKNPYNSNKESHQEFAEMNNNLVPIYNRVQNLFRKKIDRLEFLFTIPQDLLKANNPALQVSLEPSSNAAYDIFTNTLETDLDWVTITNSHSKKQITFPLKMIQYIEEYGFYGGKEDNSFRIDPEAISAVFMNQNAS